MTHYYVITSGYYSDYGIRAILEFEAELSDSVKNDLLVEWRAKRDANDKIVRDLAFEDWLVYEGYAKNAALVEEWSIDS